MTQLTSRRQFLLGSLGGAAGLFALSSHHAFAAQKASRMSFGLVTYLWGQDWDLPALIANCERAKVWGVELRTEHAHGVEPSLNQQQRREVRRRFEASRVKLVGMGTNQKFDDPEPELLRKNIEGAKAFIRLSHDVGGMGVKVKPNSFHKNVPREKTIEQIGKSLNEIAEYGEGYGQRIRLEVHGQCAELPTIHAIMQIADHPNVGVCWNCNQQDLQGKGLEYNFRLVRDRFSDTCHVRELDDPDYPYQKLIDLLVQTDCDGWVLLEARGKPADRVAALADQAKLFQRMVAEAASG